MAGIGELSVSVTARTEKARKNIRNFRKSINRLPGVISGAAKSMGGLATAAAGLVGVGAIGNEIRKSFDKIDNLAKTADMLSTTTEELGALRFAAEENGVAMSAFDGSMQRMQKRLGEAAMGTGPAAEALQHLGLNIHAIVQLPMSEQLGQIADAMQGVTRQTDKARIAADLFGRTGGAQMLNVLRHGSPVLQQYMEDAEKLGFAVNRIDAAAVEKANDAFGRIGKVVEGLTNKIAIGLAPVVEGVAKSFTEWGASSQASQDQVSESVRKIAVGLAFLRDGVSSFERVFASARAAVSEFFAFVAAKGQALLRMFADALSAIPGLATADLVGVSQKGLEAFADEMAAKAEEARAKADKAWKKPLAQDGVNKFFDELEQNIDAAKDKADKEIGQGLLKNLAGQAQTFLGSKVENTVGLLKNLGGAIGENSDALASGIANMFSSKPIQVEMAETAQRGSREEFRLLRQLQNQEANRAAKQQEKQTTLLGGVKTGVDRLATLLESSDGKLDRLADALEDLDLGEAV